MENSSRLSMRQTRVRQQSGLVRALPKPASAFPKPLHSTKKSVFRKTPRSLSQKKSPPLPCCATSVQRAKKCAVLLLPNASA